MVSCCSVAPPTRAAVANVSAVAASRPPPGQSAPSRHAPCCTRESRRVGALLTACACGVHCADVCVCANRSRTALMRTRSLLPLRWSRTTTLPLPLVTASAIASSAVCHAARNRRTIGKRRTARAREGGKAAEGAEGRAEPTARRPYPCRAAIDRVQMAALSAIPITRAWITRPA